MKRLLLALSATVAMGFCASAQDANEVDIETSDVQLEMITPAQPVQETEQEIKEREKKLREMNDEVAYAKASNSLRRGYFVLVADNIQIGNMGYRHYDINRNSNFVLVQGTDGIIQFALNTGYSGSNGLGGWTGKGEVRKQRMTYITSSQSLAALSMPMCSSPCSITASVPWPRSRVDPQLPSMARFCLTETRSTADS